MTTWQQFRADESVQISIWQIAPEISDLFAFTSGHGFTATQRERFAERALDEGARLIVPWTNATIRGDHRGARFVHIRNDVFEGTPLTDGVRPDDGFLYVVYYPEADIVWVKFVHINNEATLPIPYTEAGKRSFKFYLHGIPTSAQILSDYGLPPITFGEEFFLQVPERYNEEYVPMRRTLVDYRNLTRMSRDTIYYRSRASNDVFTHDRPALLSTARSDRRSPINPTVPWPSDSTATNLTKEVMDAGRNAIALTSFDRTQLPLTYEIDFYGKLVGTQKRTMAAVFSTRTRETTEQIEVYALDTTAGDFALQILSVYSRQMLRFFTAGVTITPPPSSRPQGPQYDLKIPTFGQIGPDESDADDTPRLPESGCTDEEIYYGLCEGMGEGGEGGDEEEESSGLSASLPLILGAAAAGFFLFNR